MLARMAKLDARAQIQAKTVSQPAKRISELINYTSEESSDLASGPKTC
jgi:hypothetical protein